MASVRDRCAPPAPALQHRLGAFQFVGEVEPFERAIADIDLDGTRERIEERGIRRAERREPCLRARPAGQPIRFRVALDRGADIDVLHVRGELQCCRVP
jgi:hypothetical protein